MAYLAAYLSVGGAMLFWTLRDEDCRDEVEQMGAGHRTAYFGLFLFLWPLVLIP